MSTADPKMAKSERPKTFRQSDLKRAISAAKGAGLEVKHVEIDPTTGKISSRQPPGQLRRLRRTPWISGWPPMRVRLKGVNHSTKRLADGSTVTTGTRGANGPRLHGEPGSAEFIASFNEAVARKVTPPTGTLYSVLQGFQRSEAVPRARRTNSWRTTPAKIKLIERNGNLPASSALRPTHAGCVSGRGAISLPCRRAGRRTTHGLSSPARCHGPSTVGSLLPTHARRVGASIRGWRADKIWTGGRRDGLPEHARQSTSICRDCSRCGLGNARATCCDCHGRPTMGRISAYSSARAGSAVSAW